MAVAPWSLWFRLTLLLASLASMAATIVTEEGTTCCRISVVCPKDRSRTARQLQAHSACRCQRASIQDIPVRVLRLKRTGFVAAQLGNCALAEVTAVIDTSAAAMRVLNVVIVVLRVVVLCGEFALAITARPHAALKRHEEIVTLSRRSLPHLH